MVRQPFVLFLPPVQCNHGGTQWAAGVKMCGVWQDQRWYGSPSFVLLLLFLPPAVQCHHGGTQRAAGVKMMCVTARYKRVVVPVVCLLPLWWRFAQCLRKYYDTGLRWPHAYNALKVTTTTRGGASQGCLRWWKVRYGVAWAPRGLAALAASRRCGAAVAALWRCCGGAVALLWRCCGAAVAL